VIYQANFGLTFNAGALHELEAITRAKFGLNEKAIARAQRRAVNKVARWFRTHLLRQISQITNLPQKSIRARFRLSLAKAGAEEQSAHIWFGSRGIDPIRIGLKGRQSGSGFRIGKFFFEGGFKAYHVKSPGSRREGIYRRKSSRRLPIIRQLIPIDEQADQVIDRLVNRGQTRLHTVLRQELEFEQKKAQGLI
jgi:hypothetical protein